MARRRSILVIILTTCIQFLEPTSGWGTHEDCVSFCNSVNSSSEHECSDYTNKPECRNLCESNHFCICYEKDVANKGEIWHMNCSLQIETNPSPNDQPDTLKCNQFCTDKSIDPSPIWRKDCYELFRRTSLSDELECKTLCKLNSACNCFDTLVPDCPYKTRKEDCVEMCIDHGNAFEAACPSYYNDNVRKRCRQLCEYDTGQVCKCKEDSIPCTDYLTRPSECGEYCTDNKLNRPAKCDEFKNRTQRTECTDICRRDRLDVCDCGRHPNGVYAANCPAALTATTSCEEFCATEGPETDCASLTPEKKRECHSICLQANECRCRDSGDSDGPKVTLICPPQKSESTKDPQEPEKKTEGPEFNWNWNTFNTVMLWIFVIGLLIVLIIMAVCMSQIKKLVTPPPVPFFPPQPIPMEFGPPPQESPYWTGNPQGSENLQP